MRRLLREPLLHFLLLGAAIFAVYSWLAGGEGRAPDEIVVSAGRIEHLAALFARTWQRPPTREELEALVDEFVLEEAVYREGAAIGLDRDDTIIRRRIRQKLDFVAGDLAWRIEPSEDELIAYLSAHPDDFRLEPRLTFRHVYLNPEERGAAIEADARTLLLTLNGDGTLDASAMGDRTLTWSGSTPAWRAAFPPSTRCATRSGGSGSTPGARR